MVWFFQCLTYDQIIPTIVDGEFEGLEVTPLSSPPELPDVMKTQDSPSTHAQEQTAS